MARVRAAAPLGLDEELELLIGPGRVRGTKEIASEWEADADRRGAWKAHRDELLENAPAHARPWAADRYET